MRIVESEYQVVVCTDRYTAKGDHLQGEKLVAVIFLQLSCVSGKWTSSRKATKAVE